MVRCDRLAGSGSSACGLCHDLRQKMGRTFLCVSVPERWRQPAPGRKYNFLWLISLYVRKPRLGSHCHFYNRDQETGFVSLGWLTVFCKCKRSMSKTFPSRKRNHRKESLADSRRTFRLHLGANGRCSICQSALHSTARYGPSRKANRFALSTRAPRNRNFISSFLAAPTCAIRRT